MTSPTDPNTLVMRPVAYARNGFTDKFGIPRQAREHTSLRTRIVFCPAFRSEDAIRGIEAFSHLWLVWGFHTVPQSDRPNLTVRPPRLGGNTRMGVFATRSPYRPNPVGLTSVRLVEVEHDANGAPVLVVEGADMMDGTPIYDIKPYLGYCDTWATATATPMRVTVLWTAHPGSCYRCAGRHRCRVACRSKNCKRYWSRIRDLPTMRIQSVYMALIMPDGISTSA